MSAVHQDRVAIVTGGGSGIGRAAATLLAAEGARVCVADLNGEAAESVAKEITEAGGEAFGLTADCSTAEANDEMVRRTVDTYGSLDIAYLNAGIARGSTIRGGDLAVWDEVLRINLSGVFLGMRAAVEPMIAAGGGSIVCTASVAGLLGGTRMPSYYASKHGVVGLVKSAAGEFAEHGIRVNAVCPGVIDTPILGPAHGVEAVTSILGRGHLLARVGRAEEVAQLVSFLASDRASFITGVAYPVDGGMTATIGSGRDDDMSEEERTALFEQLSTGVPSKDE
jgi:NAD(P)-dependent dehydrogenase (short-subunit alcohol dehydrogenase family)